MKKSVPTATRRAGILILRWKLKGHNLSISMLDRGASSGYKAGLDDQIHGEVAEWSNAAVSKTVKGFAFQEFESPPLRH